jgi:hypothetical protein
VRVRKLIVVFSVMLVGLLLFKFVWHKDPPPENVMTQSTVSGQDMASPRFPNAKLEFLPEFKYVGGQRFQLKSVADTEQQFWVEFEADGKTLKRGFWLQYEGYLPSNDYTYDYSNERPLDYAGLHWYSNKAMVNVPRRESDPDADVAKARAFFRAKGVLVPQSYMRIRMITLDDKGRNELMVMYMESPTAIPMVEPPEFKNAPPEVRDQLKRLPPVARMDWDIEKRAQQRFKVLATNGK